MTGAEIQPKEIVIHVNLTNRKGSDISIRYSAENFSAVNNLGNKLKLNFDRSGLSQGGTFTRVFRNDESETLVETEGGRAMNIELDTGDPALTEVVVTVNGVSSIQNARWRIPIKH
jgi:hypothetical protein